MVICVWDNRMYLIKLDPDQSTVEIRAWMSNNMCYNIKGMDE